MPQLYYIPASAAMAPTAALEEIGIEYELVPVERTDGVSSAEYLAVNPLGRVPAYVDGDLMSRGTVLWESAAIMIYLADRYPEAGLLPADPDERALAIRWLVYLTNTLQACLMDYIYPRRLLGDDDYAVEALRAGMQVRLDRNIDHINAELGDGPYLQGQLFTGADLYLHMLTRWCRWLPRKAWSLPNIGRHYALLSERPSVVRMLELHETEAYPPEETLA